MTPLIPALLTTTSSRPNTSAARDTAVLTCTELVTSAGTKIAAGPSSAAPARSSSVTRPVRQTLAPSATKARAVAMPNLVASHGVNPFAAIVAAAVIAAVISLPVSLLVLRLSGGYFAVATLVVATVFRIAATLSPSVGGTTGVSVPGLAGYDPVLREALIYWATLAVAVLSVAGVYLLVRRTFGLDTRAVGSDPVAAASAGVRVGRIRRLAYLVAGGGAGAVGALIALQTLYVEPTSVFNIQYSVYMLFMVRVGGTG